MAKTHMNSQKLNHIGTAKSMLAMQPSLPFLLAERLLCPAREAEKGATIPQLFYGANVVDPAHARKPVNVP
jgi:hypothetical protein